MDLKSCTNLALPFQFPQNMNTWRIIPSQLKKVMPDFLRAYYETSSHPISFLLLPVVSSSAFSSLSVTWIENTPSWRGNEHLLTVLLVLFIITNVRILHVNKSTLMLFIFYMLSISMKKRLQGDGKYWKHKRSQIVAMSGTLGGKEMKQQHWAKPLSLSLYTHACKRTRTHTQHT